MKKLLMVCLITIGLSASSFANNYTKLNNIGLNQEKITQTLLNSIEGGYLIENTRTDKIIIDLINRSDSLNLVSIQEFRNAIDSGVKMLQTTRIINIEKIQLALSIFLMFTICLFRAFWTKLPRHALPWLTVSIATASSTAVGLLIGTPADKIVIDAFIVSTSAGGLWSLIGKYICRL